MPYGSESSFEDQESKKFTGKVANKPLIFDFCELKYPASNDDDFPFSQIKIVALDRIAIL